MFRTSYMVGALVVSGVFSHVGYAQTATVLKGSPKVTVTTPSQGQLFNSTVEMIPIPGGHGYTASINAPVTASYTFELSFSGEANKIYYFCASGGGRIKNISANDGNIYGAVGFIYPDPLPNSNATNYMVIMLNGSGGFAASANVVAPMYKFAPFSYEAGATVSQTVVDSLTAPTLLGSITNGWKAGNYFWVTPPIPYSMPTPQLPKSYSVTTDPPIN